MQRSWMPRDGAAKGFLVECCVAVLGMLARKNEFYARAGCVSRESKDAAIFRWTTVQKKRGACLAASAPLELPRLGSFLFAVRLFLLVLRRFLLLRWLCRLLLLFLLLLFLFQLCRFGVVLLL